MKLFYNELFRRTSDVILTLYITSKSKWWVVLSVFTTSTTQAWQSQHGLHWKHLCCWAWTCAEETVRRCRLRVWVLHVWRSAEQTVLHVLWNCELDGITKKCNMENYKKFIVHLLNRTGNHITGAHFCTRPVQVLVCLYCLFLLANLSRHSETMTRNSLWFYRLE